MWIMVGAAWCEKCQQTKELLFEKGLWQMVHYLDFETAEGKKIAVEYGAEQIPFFVVDGELVEYVGQFLHILTERKMKEELAKEDEARQ